MRCPTRETLDVSDKLTLQARFRVYGDVAPVLPPNLREEFDLAGVFSGGRVVFTSDQHFGVGSNLIIPGRGTLVTAHCTQSPFYHLHHGTYRERHGRRLGNQAQPRTRPQRLGYHQAVSPFLTIEQRLPNPSSRAPYVSLCAIHNSIERKSLITQQRGWRIFDARRD